MKTSLILPLLLLSFYLFVITSSPTTLADEAKTNPIKVLIVTGNQYPGHLWRETTLAIGESFDADRRIQTTIVISPEFLAQGELKKYDCLVLNYCNWKSGGLSEQSKLNFQQYLAAGGGLVIVHFSNGAFHYSLPEAGKSDWPEFRKICRRVWDHTKDKIGHDPYGKFQVDIAQPGHPITRGMQPFETIDELYFNQQGDLPIEIVATARSKVTGKDEPMAFVYSYGKGRVFQTVLGHAAESIRMPGPAQLIRRGTVWAANRDQSPAAAGKLSP